MILRPLALAALLLSAACVSPGANHALQETVSLSVSLGQHEDGVDIAEASASLDEKVAATTRINLSNSAQDRALRVKLRHDALAELDRAIANAKPDAAARSVMMNGQSVDIDLSDLPDLRAKLFATVQTDR